MQVTIVEHIVETRTVEVPDNLSPEQAAEEACRLWIEEGQPSNDPVIDVHERNYYVNGNLVETKGAY